MAHRVAQQCPHRAAAELLAHERLSPAQKRHEQLHLERCESCRTAFRRITAGWLPHVRNYTILEQIGKGGFGVVYKAIHHQKQRTEALKVHFGKTPLRAAYFENEVRLIARLRHPNIATLYETNLGGSPPYYTMEFVEGQNLDEYLASRPVDLAGRIRIVRAVAEAVGYAHAQGVVHRDLKPQNILIDAGGNPRIVDFGIGKMLGIQEPVELPFERDPTLPEGAIGTFGYIAPEQAAGRAVDSRADIFALGALLYHCVTGEPARFAEQPERFIQHLRAHEVSRAEDLAAVLAKCLAHEPEQRYQTCDELIGDLDNYLTASPIAARVDRPVGYRTARFAAHLLGQYPWAVRAAVVATTASILTLLYGNLPTRAGGVVERGGETVLVAFDEPTLAALQEGRLAADVPGVDPQNRKSWRLLHARLLEVLARGRPRVVLLDYFFPDCQPEYDARFVESMRALGAPLIVGAPRFDQNAAPQICAVLGQAVHRVAAMVSADPGSANDFIVSLALIRGYEAAIPTLPLAAFAAYRAPDCDAELLVRSDSELEIRYRRRAFAEGERRFRADADSVPIVGVQQVAGGPLLAAGDGVANGSIRRADRAAALRRISYADILAAGDEQLAQWLRGRVVVVGQMLAPADLHRDRDGNEVFGCEIVALAVQSLLDGVFAEPLTWRAVAVRAVAWCGLAMFAAVLAGRLLARVPLSGLLAMAGALAVGGVSTAWHAGQHVSTPWLLEGAIALSAAAATGGVALLLEALRTRQLRLAPGPTWSTEPSTLAATSAAETQRLE